MKMIPVRSVTGQNNEENLLRIIVEHCGGRFIGVQKCATPSRHLGILIVGTPCGATAEIWIDEKLTIDLIQRRIAEKEAAFFGCDSRLDYEDFPGLDEKFPRRTTATCGEKETRRPD